MQLPPLVSDRFYTESGLHVRVQVPESREAALRSAILSATALQYGDYDSVTFTTAPGTQRYRSCGTGRNAATPDVVDVPCVELTFFLENDVSAAQVIEAIYADHPYEEPVILVQPCLRTRHIRGMDEDNPNRFWNRPGEDWVPGALRDD